MGGLYHFTRLIHKYAKCCGPVKICRGDEVVELTAAVLAVTEEVEPGMGGSRNKKDREMVCCQKVELLFGEDGAGTALQELRVEYDGEEYSLSVERDYGDFADVFLYKLLYVRPLSGRYDDGGGP